MRSDSLALCFCCCFFQINRYYNLLFFSRQALSKHLRALPSLFGLCVEYKYERAAISSKSFSLSEFLSHGHAHNSISPSQIAVQWPCFEGERSESSRGEELRGGRGKEKSKKEGEVKLDTTRVSWQVLAALALRLIDQM